MARATVTPFFAPHSVRYSERPSAGERKPCDRVRSAHTVPVGEICPLDIELCSLYTKAVERRTSDAYAGLLLGTAVGDAVGLPREGLSARRAARLFGGGPLRMQLLPLGRGLCSDDTEHAAMTAQALLASGGDPAAFARSLAWRLRGWLLGLPAGVGWATLRATLKLWLGWPPARSGVWSAGNGPAMRAAVIGLFARDDEHLRALVAASTRLTHADPRAEAGARVVAWAARLGAEVGPVAVTFDRFWSAVDADLPEGELRRALGRLREGPDIVVGPAGVSGYVNHTVPAAVAAWLAHPGDVRGAVEWVVRLGGDADTTGAIAGALVGATAGAAAVPADWTVGLAEWPRSVGWLRRLAVRLADGGPPLPLFWPGLVARNLVFAVVVIGHGVRRLLPPW